MLKHLVVDSTDFTQQSVFSACVFDALPLWQINTDFKSPAFVVFDERCVQDCRLPATAHKDRTCTQVHTCPRHLSLWLSAYCCCWAPGEKRHLNCGARGITLGERTTMHCCAALPFCRYVPERCHLPDSAGKGKSRGHRLVKHKWSEQQLGEVPSHKMHRFVAQDCPGATGKVRPSSWPQSNHRQSLFILAGHQVLWTRLFVCPMEGIQRRSLSSLFLKYTVF